MTRAKTFNLAGLLRIAVDTVPEDREALVCAGRRVTFRQFYEQTQKLASWLRSQGIEAGDTIGIHAYNSIEFVEATFAAYMLKAIPVNVNYRYTVDEARYIYDNARLKGLVYCAAVEDCVAEAIDGVPPLKVLLRIDGGVGAGGIPHAVPFEHAVATGSGSLDDIELSDDDLVILYTGGTTGMPKGVIWPHKHFFYAALGGGGSLNPAGPIKTPEELADRINTTYPLRVLPCGPLIHGNGMWATMISLLAGCTTVLNDQPDLKAEHILDLVVREKVTVINVVGDAMVLPLVKALRAHPGRWDLSRIVCIPNGGALLSQHVADALRAFLPPTAIILDSMGSSETGTSGAGSKPAGGGLVQLPPGPTVAVLVDGVRFAQPGETGILVRMGHLPLGYYGDPQKTAATFVTVDGKRCAISGDSARLEADGSITVFGRDSLCINTGGEKVFTEEVEEVLRSCDSVADALVVGVADSRWGQKVVGVVSVRANTSQDAEALKKHCRQKLAGYKVPKAVVFVSEVPRGPTGKADYRWARAVAERELPQD